MSRSNYNKPFYVDVGTSIVAVRCASTRDVVFECDHSRHPFAIELAEEACDRMNREAEIGRPSGDSEKLREAICTLRTALKEIRDDVLDMVMNHKNEDPDSYAHGLCLSIGGACDMALNSTKEFEEGGAE